MFNGDERAELIVPYHFHPVGEEYMSVTRGYIDVTLQGKKTRLTPEMGEFHIPAGQRHSLHKPKGVFTMAQERASPDAAGKSRFFEEFFIFGEMVSLRIIGTLHSLLYALLSLRKYTSLDFSMQWPPFTGMATVILHSAITLRISSAS